MVDIHDPELHSHDSTDCNWSVLAHLSTLAGYVIPLANVVLPLAILLTKGRESRFIEAHAREALNFQITILVYGFVAFLLVFVLVGFVLLPLIAVFDVVCVVLASVEASKGRPYTYPMTLRLVRG